MVLFSCDKCILIFVARCNTLSTLHNLKNAMNWQNSTAQKNTIHQKNHYASHF